jgi:dGTPase
MELIPGSLRRTRLETAHSDGRRVQILRSIAIGAAIEKCAKLFLENKAALLNGSFDAPLIDAGPDRVAWQHIEKISWETIDSMPCGVEIKSAGFEVLGGLLDVHVSALNDHARTSGKPAPRNRTLLLLLPGESLGPGWISAASAYDRLLGIFDFVSGMTDTYAATLYKRVRGISLSARQPDERPAFAFGLRVPYRFVNIFILPWKTPCSRPSSPCVAPSLRGPILPASGRDSTAFFPTNP